jgi:penicillin-binding protein 1B
VRQIGSLYKPVVYLTALEQPQRYTFITPLDDTEIHLANADGGWDPKNYDRTEHGPVPLHYALAHSLNLATVRLGLDLGVAHTVRTLRRLGVTRDVEVFPSTLLGALTLTPWDVTQVYQTLANDGFITPLRAIQAVVSQDGKPLKRYELNVRQVVDPAAVYLVDRILQEAVREGTGKPVYTQLPQSFEVVGKTGTTNDLRDSWFAGFTGDYLGVVWVGRDDNKPANLTGAQGALPIWAAAMKGVSRVPVQLSVPDNVENVWVDPIAMLRSASGCPGAEEYPFIVGSAPDLATDCAIAKEEEAPPSRNVTPLSRERREQDGKEESSGSSWIRDLF